MKSSSDLRVSIPAHEMPPQHWWKLSLKGRALQNNVAHHPIAVADLLLHTLKGIQAKDQDEAVCTRGKLASLWLVILQEKISWTQFLESSHT